MDDIAQYHKRNSEMFHSLYSELRNIEVTYKEHSGPGDEGIQNIVPITKEGLMDGRYISCSEENCTGKYDLFSLIRSAMNEKLKEINPQTLFCNGRYMSPKRRKVYRECERSISVSLKLIYDET